MVRYHPDVSFLTDYAAGSLSPSQALCVATHLHYCMVCRLKVHRLTELGTALFQQQPRVVTKIDEFDRLLERIDGLIDTNPHHDVEEMETGSLLQASLPRPLRKLAKDHLEKRDWHSVGKGYSYCRLKVNDSRETALIHITAGGSVPHHRHAGDEITVVIWGGFSDQDDHYGPGDFIVRISGEQHQPMASAEEDCLCLSTLDKPLVMSSLFHRLFSPLA